MYDVLIIGAGSMGAAAGYYLAKEGKRVCLLDTLNPPHDFGSHHGDTRLIRFAYGEGERYVPFALRAGELWDELEQLTSKVLFKRIGVINFAPHADPFIQNVAASAQRYDIPLEQLTASEAMKRWPAFRFNTNHTVLYEPSAGVLLTKPIIESYIELALAHGATLLANRRVTAITPNENGVEVTTATGETFIAARAIVTVGAWAQKLLAETGLSIPVTPIRKTFAWFEADETLFSEEVLPGFAYINGEIEGYYGFPSIDGAGLKVGRHDLGEFIDPDDERLAFGEVAGDETDLVGYIKRFMPQAGKLKFGKTCMYAMTPDEDFIIDTHPKHPQIAIAAGFSGHGFKFASAVGEALKDIVTNSETKVDLTPFSLKRFA